MGNTDRAFNLSDNEVKSVLEEIAEPVVAKVKTIGDDERETLLYHTYYPKIITGSEIGVPVAYERAEDERVLSFPREVRMQIRNEINPDAFQRLSEIIESVFKGHGQIGAYHFVDRLLKQPENKEEIIRITLETILQVPTDWSCIVFLNGLVCKNHYTVDEMTIRPPKATDFKSHKVLIVKGVTPNIPPEIMKPQVYAVSSVLEFIAHKIPRGYIHTFAGNYREVLSAIEKEVRILRLSVGGGWKYSSWFAETDQAILWTSIDNRLPMEEYRIKLGIIEYSYFKDKERDVYNLVRNTAYPEYIERINESSRKLRSALRAIKMFDEASVRPPLESILFSIIGLEAILQRGSGEMRLKLSTRAAVLLDCLGYSRSDVFRDIYDAYGLRSKFVHGDSVEDEVASGIAPKILEYLRLAILMWLESDCKSSNEETDLQLDLERASMQNEKLKEIRKRFKIAIERFVKL